MITTYTLETYTPEGLAEILQTHCSAWFDSVTVDGSVICTAAGVPLVTINANYVTITDRTGQTASVSLGSYNNAVPKRLTVCENGFILEVANGSTYFEMLAVGKDVSGSTAVALLDVAFSPYKLYSVSAAEDGILTQYPSFTDVGALGKYGLCPLYTPDTGFANVWIPVIRQFTTLMPVRIGSVQYLAGMFFIIKDA